MSSPDVRPYVDLTVYDDDPVVVFNEILQAGRALLPNWTPAVGQIEATLAEAFAMRSTEVAAAINRLPSATAEVLLQLFGITRSGGTKASATVSLTFTGSTTLPKGTEFLYVDSVARVSYIFTLDSELAIAGPTTTTATVSASTVGAKYNLSVDGAPLALLSNVSAFLSAQFTTSPSGGSEPETDSQYFDRGVTLLASFTTAATTADQIKYYTVANKSYANRVEVYNRRRYRDRDTTSADYALHDGSVLVAVAKLSVNDLEASVAEELPVAASNLADLYESLDSRTPAGLTIDVMSAELAAIDINISLAIKDGYLGTTVTAAVETALKEYFNPNTWEWASQTIRRNEVISLIDNVEGVDYVSSLSMRGRPLIGYQNVGHYVDSGGAKASCSFNISGAASNATYAAGAAAYYFVDSLTDQDTPVVYTFTNNASFATASNGSAGNIGYTAVSNGINYNDSNNGGKITPSAKLVGSTGGAGGTASAVVIAGGVDDYPTFTAMSSATAYSSNDIILRNLGTLVTFGQLTVSVVG